MATRAVPPIEAVDQHARPVPLEGRAGRHRQPVRSQPRRLQRQLTRRPEPHQPAINGNGTFVGGTANNVYPLVRGMYNKREDEINAFGWNNEFNSAQARVTADVSWSKAEPRRAQPREQHAAAAGAAARHASTSASTGNGFSHHAPGPGLLQPGHLFLANTIYGSGYGKTPKVDGRAEGLQAQRQLRRARSLEVLRRLRLRRQLRRPREDQAPAGRQHQPRRAGRHDDRLATCSIGSVDLGFAGVGCIPSWNVPGAVGALHDLRANETLSTWSPKAWTVNEEITTAYAAGQHRHRMGFGVRCAATSACRSSAPTSPRTPTTATARAAGQRQACSTTARPTPTCCPA